MVFLPDFNLPRGEILIEFWEKVGFFSELKRATLRFFTLRAILGHCLQVRNDRKLYRIEQKKNSEKGQQMAPGQYIQQSLTPPHRREMCPFTELRKSKF